MRALENISLKESNKRLKNGGHQIQVYISGRSISVSNSVKKNDWRTTGTDSKVSVLVNTLSQRRPLKRDDFKIMVSSRWEQTKHVSATTYNCTIGSFWRMRLWWILFILHFVQRFSLNTGSAFFSFKTSLPLFSFFLFFLSVLRCLYTFAIMPTVY